MFRLIMSNVLSHDVREHCLGSFREPCWDSVLTLRTCGFLSPRLGTLSRAAAWSSSSCVCWPLATREFVLLHVISPRHYPWTIGAGEVYGTRHVSTQIKGRRTGIYVGFERAWSAYDA
jgi:hypothetical protein